MADENKKTVTTEELISDYYAPLQTKVDDIESSVTDLVENSINTNNWLNYICYNGAFSTATTYTYNNLVLWQKINRNGGYCIESTIIYTFTFKTDTNINTGGAILTLGAPKNGSHYTGPLVATESFLVVHSEGRSNVVTFLTKSNGVYVSMEYAGSGFTFTGGKKYEIRMKYSYNPTFNTASLINAS